VKENEIPFIEHQKTQKRDIVIDFFKQHPDLLLEASRFVNISNV